MRPLLFLIVFLSLLIGSNIYLTKRFSSFFNLSSSWYLYLAFAAITIFMIGGFILFSNMEGTFAHLAYVLAAFLMGFMLYLLLSTIGIDLVSLFVKIPASNKGTMAILLALSVSFFGVWNASHKRIIEVDIPISGLNTDIKAVHLTDIHLGHIYGNKHLQEIVTKTNEQQPDVVFVTGDLFDGKIGLSRASVDAFKDFDAPVYFVEGNHDRYSGTQKIKKQLSSLGVNVLENEVTHFNQLQIIGLDHMRADANTAGMHASDDDTSVKSTLEELDIFPNKPTILLHHSPDGVEYANKHGVDLFLAGHTHAGQMFPVIFVAKWMFAYNKGLHDFKGTKMYVSQGVGTFGPPLRVGTSSEITVLNLKPKR
jgi:predicted MPP superfamily phosphohydrolase